MAACNVRFIVACSSMLAFGTMNVVMKDWQTRLGFYAPYLWNFATFLGQSLFLPIYYSRSDGEELARDPEEAATAKPPAPIRAFALVTLFDFGALSLVNVAYSGLPGSMLQMLKGVKLLFTVVLSVAVLGKRLRGQQYVGVFLNIAGLGLIRCVALGGTGWSTPESACASLTIGLGSCLVGALQFVYEERTMRQYAVEPELLAGMEGLIGMGYSVVALVVADLAHAESIPGTLAEIRQSRAVLCAVLLFLFAVATFNYSALVVTQDSSATTRSLLDVARTSCIWLLELLCHWTRFSWVELAGFAIMASGIMIYSRAVELPCFPRGEERPLLPAKKGGEA